MFNNPFSFEGRIRRSEFGISFILFVLARVIVTLIAATIIASQSNASGGMLLSLLMTIPIAWFLWAQGAKRCHDLGNSGWFQLIPFYMIWMIFQDGVPGPNQYGENPKDIQNNYYNSSNQYPNGQNQHNNKGYQGNYGGGHNSTGHNQQLNNQNADNTGGYKNGSLYN